jgi:hypothetical protein
MSDTKRPLNISDLLDGLPRGAADQFRAALLDYAADDWLTVLGAQTFDTGRGYVTTPDGVRSETDDEYRDRIRRPRQA